MAVRILSEYKDILDCHSCDDKLKEERGCEKKGIVPFYLEDGVYFRCPLTLITDLSWQYLKAYSLYEKGVLPNNCGWLRESNKFIQAMFILDSTFAKYQTPTREK